MAPSGRPNYKAEIYLVGVAGLQLCNKVVSSGHKASAKN